MVIYFHEINGHLLYLPDFEILFCSIWCLLSSFWYCLMKWRFTRSTANICPHLWISYTKCDLRCFMLSTAAASSSLVFLANSTNSHSNWEVLWIGNFLGKLPSLVYINISFIQAIHLFIQPIFVRYILGIGTHFKYKALKMPPMRCLI